MKEIRVGLSTTRIEPALTHGHLDGIGVYTTALMNGLPAADCRVTGFTFPGLTSGLPSDSFTVGRKMPHSYAISSMQDLLMPWSAKSLPVDLYHATDYRIVRMACPIVATLHDAIPIRHPEWTSQRMRSLKNWVQKKAAAKADHVIALSRSAVPELVECFGIDERKITVVPCGVDSRWQTLPSASSIHETLTEYGLQQGYFLYVGTLQPRKNVERILAAYLGLPNEVRRARQLVLVGRPGWLCEDVIRQIQTAVQDGERVVWLNNVSDHGALHRIYGGAGVFVFPSLHEGFGIPVVEAFAVGVPVVTSNTTSLPEVSQGAALEVDPLSVNAIAEAMHALVREDGLREQCIAAGRRRAAQLTWQQTVEKTAAVYREVLGR